MKLKSSVCALVLKSVLFLKNYTQKTVFFAILILFVVAGLFFSAHRSTDKIYAAGTTRYVDCNVGSSGNGLSWTAAYITLNESVVAAQAGDTVYISGGTYDEYFQITTRSGSVGSYIKFIGSTEAGHNTPVIVSNATNHQILINKDYIWLENINENNASSGKDGIIVSGDHDVFRNIKMTDNYSGFLASNGTNVDIDGLTVIGNNLSGYSFLTAGATTSGTIKNLIVRNSDVYQARTLKFNTAGAWTIDHAVLSMPSSTNTILNSGAGTLLAENSVIMGSSGSNTTVSNTGTGSVTLTNNVVLPSSPDPAYFLSAGVIDGGGNVYRDPILNSYARSGYVNFAVDDYDITYAEQMAAIVNPLGMKVSFNVAESLVKQQPDYQARLLAFVAKGNEVANHSYSHTDLTKTSAFSVTGTGTNPTIIVDRVNDIIRLSDTENGNQDIAGFKAKTLEQIRTEINTKVGFSAGAMPDNLNTLGESLAELTETPCLSAKTLDLDLTTDGSKGYFKVEIFDTKIWLEDLLGVPCTQFVTPFSLTSATVITAEKNAGYTNARGSYGIQLTSLKLFNIVNYDATNNLLKDNAIERNTGAMLVHAAQKGEWLQILSHSTIQMSLANLAIIANEVKKTQGIDYTKTPSEIANYITTSGNWATADSGLTYTRSYTDGSNYHLMSTSPAIDAGIDTGTTTDLDGNPIYGTPDIGAYEYQPPHLAGTDKIDIDAGARIYADGKFRNVSDVTGTMADLDIAPLSGSFNIYGATEVRPQWLDITNIAWNNTGSHHKSWTELSTFAGLTNTIHTVGDLVANRNYNVKVDGVLGQDITGAGCIDGVCTANTQGKITFTYTGSYSTHVFDVEDAVSSPIITNQAVGLVTASEATLNGVIASTGGENVITRGFKYYQSSDCTGTEYDKSQSGSYSMGSYSLTLTGLLPNKSYSYKAYSANTIVQGDGTSCESLLTLANTPSAPSLYAASSSSIRIIINENGNPSDVQFAILNIGSGQWVQADGTLGFGQVWQTRAGWGGDNGVVNTGLSASTQYLYKVKAKNTANMETGLSNESARYTDLLAESAILLSAKASSTSANKIKSNLDTLGIAELPSASAVEESQGIKLPTQEASSLVTKVEKKSMSTLARTAIFITSILVVVFSILLFTRKKA